MGGRPATVWALFAVALLLGILVVLPIGGGDMPVDDLGAQLAHRRRRRADRVRAREQVLVVAGMLVGASGRSSRS